MLTLTNISGSTVGPYNGLSIASSASSTISGSVAPYISDGTLLSDIINDKLTVTFCGKELRTAAAAALLMQLGSLIATDSDGAHFGRIKQAPAGWTYQMRGFEAVTSTANSLHNKDHTKANLSDVTVKFYDEDNELLTEDEDITAYSVRTVIDFEPIYDYYVIGGRATLFEPTETNVILNAVGVPDVPANMGGTKILIQNVNFKFINADEWIHVDGRASKALLYNATYHTNKIRFIVDHPAGAAHNVCILMEIYKQ